MVPNDPNLVPRVFVPLDQRSETRRLGATISGMRRRCRLCSETGWADLVISKWLLSELSFSDHTHELIGSITSRCSGERSLRSFGGTDEIED